MESFDRGVITSQTFRPHRSVERGKNTILLHDLVLGDTASRLGTLHGVYGASACIHVLDKSDAERTATVLITGELGYTNVSVCSGRCSLENIPIAVSAVSALSNWTTPVPRERPLGSY